MPEVKHRRSGVREPDDPRQRQALNRRVAETVRQASAPADLFPRQLGAVAEQDSLRAHLAHLEQNPLWTGPARADEFDALPEPHALGLVAR